MPLSRKQTLALLVLVTLLAAALAIDLVL